MTATPIEDQIRVCGGVYSIQGDLRAGVELRSAAGAGEPALQRDGARRARRHTGRALRWIAGDDQVRCRAVLR